MACINRKSLKISAIIWLMCAGILALANQVKAVGIASADNKDSVVGHWNFLNVRNDTVLDMSGNNNHARLYNTKKDPKGRLFGDTKDSCEVTDNPTFYLTKSFTIEAFCVIKGYPAWTSSNFQNHSGIVYRGDGRSGNDPYFLAVEPENRNYDQQWLKYIRFRIESSSSNESVGVPADPLLNTPVYIAAVLNDATSKMSIYINGEKKTEKQTTVRPFGALIANQAPGVGLGCHPATIPGNSPYRFPFVGILEEIRVVNYAMSDQEIQTRNTNGPTKSLFWPAKAGARNAGRSLASQKVVCLNNQFPIRGKKAFALSGQPVASSHTKLTGVYIIEPIK